MELVLSAPQLKAARGAPGKRVRARPKPKAATTAATAAATATTTTAATTTGEWARPEPELAQAAGFCGGRGGTQCDARCGQGVGACQ